MTPKTLFDQRLSHLILALCLPLLFLPKFNFIQIKNETAGVRLDDIVIAVLGMILLLALAISRKPLGRMEMSMVALTLVSVLAVVYSHYQGLFLNRESRASLLYAIRPLEYFLIFYVGLLASRYFKGYRFIRLFVGYCLLIMTLQFLGLLGGVTVNGITSRMTYRVVGVCSFPSEMGLLLNIMYCYLVFSPKSDSPQPRRHYLDALFVKVSQNPYIVFAVFSFFVILTGNRISILALFISFIFSLKKPSRVPRSFRPQTIIGCLLLLVVMVGLVFSINGAYDRSARLFSFRNLAVLPQVWASVSTDRDPLTTLQLSTNCDLSWWMRIHKWIYALKLFLHDPGAWLVGLGPGALGSALDGGLLRILFEGGLVGSALYLLVFREIARSSLRLRWVMIVFLINMIFFDAHIAYKVMSLIYLLAGIDIGESSAPRLDKQTLSQSTTLVSAT